MACYLKRGDLMLGMEDSKDKDNMFELLMNLPDVSHVKDPGPNLRRVILKPRHMGMTAYKNWIKYLFTKK
jgi:hypothetical protein